MREARELRARFVCSRGDLLRYCRRQITTSGDQRAHAFDVMRRRCVAANAPNAQCVKFAEFRIVCAVVMSSYCQVVASGGLHLEFMMRDTHTHHTRTPHR